MTQATMMTRERPAWLDVLRAQFVLLLRAARPVLLLVVVATVWTVALYITVANGEVWEARRMVGGEWLVLMFLLGAVWGVQLWQDEGPDRRAQHWRMPVDTVLHDIARVAAGAAWLALGITLFLICGFALLAAYGELGLALGFTPLYWLSFYTSGLLGFLGMAAFTTMFKRGLEWSLLFAGSTFVAWVELVAWGQGYPEWLEPLARLLGATLSGAYGLGRAVTGTGELAIRGHGLDPVSIQQADGSMIRGEYEIWTWGDWAFAVLAWLVAFSLAVAAAAYWHRRRRSSTPRA